MKKKNHEPVDLDIHLKYRCPNVKCGCDHWLSLKETKIKNFKVVCDCDTIFSPKQIKTIDIIYLETETIIDKSDIKSLEDESIPKDLLEKSTKTLINYGFTKEESEKLLISSYIKNITDDCSTLIKKALKSIGVLNG
jgi:hypothetical protein